MRIDSRKWEFRPIILKWEIRHKILISWYFLKHKIHSSTIHNYQKEPQEKLLNEQPDIQNKHVCASNAVCITTFLLQLMSKQQLHVIQIMLSNYSTSIYSTCTVKTLTVKEMPVHYTCQSLYKIQPGNSITWKLQYLFALQETLNIIHKFSGALELWLCHLLAKWP